jgi:inhibitor of KinA
MQIFAEKKGVDLLNTVEYNRFKIIALSSTSLLVVFGENIEIAINQKVMALYFLLKQKQLPWIRELTPAYASLGITYDLKFIKSNVIMEGLAFNWAKNEVENYLKETIKATLIENEIIEIPICFDNVLPNDLYLFEETLQLPTKEIIDIFLNKTYHVFMLGFLPGFTYMGEVDDRLAFPRKKTPTQIKAGAVGIAGSQTGIYPLDSLGGWHILGHTPFKMFNEKNIQPNFLSIGDKIKFIQITEKQYFEMQNETTT